MHGILSGTGITKYAVIKDMVWKCSNRDRKGLL